jgi:hypothetical protein
METPLTNGSGAKTFHRRVRHAPSGQLEGISPTGSNAVDLPVAASTPFQLGLQIAFGGKGMEERVHRARPDEVTVSLKFLDRPLSIERLFARVMQDM